MLRSTFERMIIDTHAHIYLPDFRQDLSDVVDRARTAGVKYFLLPNVDSTTIEDMHLVADRYPDHALPMMGLHPCSVKPDSLDRELDLIQEHLFKPVRRYWAVGEIGVDLYWDKSTLAIQQEAFGKQIQWAKALGLPVVIHVRDAFDEAFEVVDSYNDERLRGVFHCFTGTKNQAERIIGFGGFKLGIGGVLTFKNGKIDRFIHEVGLEHLLLETDAPYLAPSPHRGKRNEPAYAHLVMEKLAACLGRSEMEIAAETTKNAIELFNLNLSIHADSNHDSGPHLDV